MPAISAPLPQFFDSDGSPLSGGYIYVGTSGGNPETSPVTVYWDQALTQPAVQPLRTVGGMIARGGTPAPAYISQSEYSITVRDSRRQLVVYQADAEVAGGGSASTVDTGFGGMWPDVTPAAVILRMRDRVFVGDGAAVTGNNSGTQGGKVPTATEGANWGVRDAQFLSFSTNGTLAVVGFSRSEDTTRNPSSAIGVAGFVIGNNAIRSSWGLYSDVQYEQGPYAYGVELAVKNKGANTTSTPYFQTTGTYGIWLPGGGDPSYGGAPTNPNNTAIAVGKNGSTWNRGIVFFADGITGTDGTTGTGIAIELAKGHIINWRAPGNLAGFGIRSDVSAAASDVALVAGNNSITLFGTGGVQIAAFSHSAGAENYFTFQNRAAASGGPRVLAQGPGADVDLEFLPKGAGVMRFGTHTGSADAPISGYITIKDTSGNVRKLAVIS